MRQDLVYRLNVVCVRVPPLRERGDDVVALTHHLAARHAAILGRPAPHVSNEAVALIRNYAWPGNVRELENALARAVAMSQHGVILPGDLPTLTVGAASGRAAPIDSDWPTLEVLQRRYIERVLAQSGQNKTAAAAILGIDRRTIQRLGNRDEE